MKKLLMAGHSVEDHFIRNGAELVQPGGIFYSAAALHAIMREQDTLHLCTTVQHSNYHLFSTLYQQLTGSPIRFSERIPTIYLTLHENREREERYENLSDPLDFSGIAPEGYDGIFLNLITAFEFKEGFIASLRAATNAPIYVDVHSLARGLNEQQERHFRQVPNPEKWLTGATFVQANEHELRTLSTRKAEAEQAEDVLRMGALAVLLTKGSKGARCYYRERGETASAFVPALHVNAVNSIGCGDTFGAVFFYTYILTGDIPASLQRANAAAGLVVSYDSVTKIGNLKQDVADRYY